MREITITWVKTKTFKWQHERKPLNQTSRFLIAITLKQSDVKQDLGLFATKSIDILNKLSAKFNADFQTTAFKLQCRLNEYEVHETVLSSKRD